MTQVIPTTDISACDEQEFVSDVIEAVYQD